MPSTFFFFFFNDTATTEIYTLSLHDALPILHRTVGRLRTLPWDAEARAPPLRDSTVTGDRKSTRLNSSHLVISYAVFCLKKKKNKSQTHCESANRTKLTWLAGERSYWGFS